jgi:hypothetical protein
MIEDIQGQGAKDKT